MSNSNEATTTDTPPSLADSLNSETAMIEWQELARHFARGVVIHVDSSLDLVDVAVSMAQDEKDKIEQWLEQGVVNRASDDNARDWSAREPTFWCVVAAPWVLVQEKANPQQLH